MGDEELPQPRRHGDRPRAQWLRFDLGIASVLLVGVALVLSALSSTDSTPRPGGSTGATSSTGAVASPTTGQPQQAETKPFVTLTRTNGAWIPRAPLVSP
jgi:hypothetical protein